MRHRHAAVLALLLAAACSDAAGPTRFTANGKWSGQETIGSTVVSLTLAQSGQSVSGSGVVSVSKDIPVTVAGSLVESDFELTLTSPGYQPVSVRGAFTSRNEILAYMVGSGFYADEIVLKRQ